MNAALIAQIIRACMSGIELAAYHEAGNAEYRKMLWKLADELEKMGLVEAAPVKPHQSEVDLREEMQAVIDAHKMTEEDLRRQVSKLLVHNSNLLGALKEAVLYFEYRQAFDGQATARQDIEPMLAKWRENPPACVGFTVGAGYFPDVTFRYADYKQIIEDVEGKGHGKSDRKR